jgi:hypothetical protein
MGDFIRLTGAAGDAKIYYTLDGSAPTVESAMYNCRVSSGVYFVRVLGETRKVIVK